MSRPHDQALSAVDAVLKLPAPRLGMTLLLAASSMKPVIHHTTALRAVGDGRVRATVYIDAFFANADRETVDKRFAGGEHRMASGPAGAVERRRGLRYLAIVHRARPAERDAGSRGLVTS